MRKPSKVRNPRSLFEENHYASIMTGARRCSNEPILDVKMLG